MGIDVQQATPDTFDQLIQGDEELVVAYFWGPECPNCEIFARDFPGLLAELAPARVRVVKVNAYEHPELARRFGIFGIPSFVLFKGGTRLGMMRQYYGREYWRTVVLEQAAGTGKPVG
jgi:thiol-disulfide isomerase/thioredoxin